jgi:hypothetical protein
MPAIMHVGTIMHGVTVTVRACNVHSVIVVACMIVVVCMIVVACMITGVSGGALAAG